jgi:hypothetical protein
MHAWASSCSETVESLTCATGLRKLDEEVDSTPLELLLPEEADGSSLGMVLKLPLLLLVLLLLVLLLVAVMSIGSAARISDSIASKSSSV